ncbi:hypothetical protein CPI84_11315 [Erwinia pyrifoliae]|nr:hypothetical protein CPI84_11315 [Erwinia pyrifoliae]
MRRFLISIFLLLLIVIDCLIIRKPHISHRLQNGDDLVFGKTGFAHNGLLRGIISMPEDL